MQIQKGFTDMKDSLYGELTVIGMQGSESFVERVDGYLKEIQVLQEEK